MRESKQDAALVFPALIADLECRNELGRLQHGGRELDAFDPPRDWLTEAYEEALDMCVYLKGALMERDGGRGLRTEDLGLSPLPVPVVRRATPDWLNVPPVVGTVVEPRPKPEALMTHPVFSALVEFFVLAVAVGVAAGGFVIGLMEVLR